VALDFGQTEKFFPLGLSIGPARNKQSAVIVLFVTQRHVCPTGAFAMIILITGNKGDRKV